jgi:hypothetical protein
LTKLKVGVAALLAISLLVSSAAAWARHARQEPLAVAALAADVPKAKPRLEAPPAPAPEPEQWITRTVHGIVRDEQGRPVAKAWIGGDVTRRPDRWQTVILPERLRERKEPYRDDQGKIVPPGEIGKYVELQDETGEWHAIHPADLRRAHYPDLPQFVSPFFESDGAALVVAPTGHHKLLVRKFGGFLKIEPLQFDSIVANRTDPLGRFSIEVSISTLSGNRKIHFASPDSSQLEIHAVCMNDPDRPLEKRSATGSRRKTSA